jgi:hypothetical protein
MVVTAGQHGQPAARIRILRARVSGDSVTGSGRNGGAGFAEARPAKSLLYPWYDSVWLSKYEEAKAILRSARPDTLAAFVEAFRIFHARPDFKVKSVEQPFDAATLAEIRRVAGSLKPADLELHEARQFGRFVVHNHPFFTELQRRAVSWISEAAGEPLEASYNFLSLYSSSGVCAVHLDAPSAKWTLDVCIDQSAPWPIYLSEVQPWPESVAEERKQEDWEDRIKRSQSLEFTPYVLQPGKAILFSGSSQWHYREPMPEAGGKCTLLFFHFIPRGTAELVCPQNWARLFDAPELGGLSEKKVEEPAKLAQAESPVPAAGRSAAAAATSGASKRA